MPEISGNIKKWSEDNEFNTQVEFFIIDSLLGEYIINGVSGVASIHYADGSIAYSIVFDEYFGNSNGGFKVAFTSLPNYEYQKVRIDIQSPIQEMLEFNLGDVEAENIINSVDKISKPLDI